jgi:hypothetical protein
MNANRFSDDMMNSATPRLTPQFSNAFLLVSVAAGEPADQQTSSMQWIYQQMYQQAMQAQQPKPQTVDLFARMN